MARFRREGRAGITGQGPPRKRDAGMNAYWPLAAAEGATYDRRPSLPPTNRL